MPSPCVPPRERVGSRDETAVKALIKASLMKVLLELKILFSSLKRGTLWAYIYFLGDAFQLDLFFHFLYVVCK